MEEEKYVDYKVYFLSGGALNIGIWVKDHFVGPCLQYGSLVWKEEKPYAMGIMHHGVAKVNTTWADMYDLHLGPGFQGSTDTMRTLYVLGEVHRDVREGIHDGS